MCKKKQVKRKEPCACAGSAGDKTMAMTMMAAKSRALASAFPRSAAMAVYF
jgi:hypothetical protein